MNHHNDYGETNPDLTLGQPHPAETQLPYEAQEAAIRRHGRRCRRTGTTTLVTTYLISLAVAVLADANLFHHQIAQLFGVLSLVILNTLGGVALSAGLHERRQRPERAMFRVAVLKASENGAKNDDNGRRLDRIEAHLDAIAEHLPDALDRANWKGFTSAVEQGFLEDTGTQPEHHPRRHLSVADPTQVTRPRPPS